MIDYTPDNTGNILQKYDAGVMQYGTDGAPPNAVSRIDSSEFDMLPQHIAYTPFNKVAEIAETNGDKKVSVEYGSDFQRKRVTGNGGHLETIYIGKGFERHTMGQNANFNNPDGVYDISYIYGKDGLLAFYLIKTDTAENDPIIGQMYYVHKDHLGSPVAITDENAEVLARYSYDAWGRARNPYDLTYSDIQEEFAVFNRGYTGHEHIKDFDLINMNGRVYDPITARFLSPDNYIQMSSNSQNLNRYSYCLNNPLIHTDPDGEWVHLVIGGLIGGIANLIANTDNIENFWDGVYYFNIGGLAGSLAAGVGMGVSSYLATGSFTAGFLGTSTYLATGAFAGATAGFAAGATSGFVLGAGNAIIQEESFGSALNQGLHDAYIGAAFGAFTGAAFGAFDAWSNDLHPITGADKQNVVIRIDKYGNAKITGSENYENMFPTTKEHYRTYINDNPNIVAHADGSYSLTVPKKVNAVTGLKVQNNIYTDGRMVENSFVFFPTDRVEYVTFHGWRYHSTPTTTSRFPFNSLFHRRKVEWRW